MTSAKALCLALVFLLLSSPCFAKSYMSVKIGATAQFIYVQQVDDMRGKFAIPTDVTHRVPYAIQKDSDETVLTIY